MTAPALAVVSTPSPTADLAPAPTVADLRLELVQLEAALRDTVALINDQPARERAVQRALVESATGTGSSFAVGEAQAALDACIEAMNRRAHLDRAIAELHSSLKYAEGQERIAFVKGIAAAFEREMAEHKAKSADLEQSFRRLHRLSIQHSGLTGTPLLWADSYLNFNLFAVRRPADSAAFSLGTIISQER